MSTRKRKQKEDLSDRISSSDISDISDADEGIKKKASAPALQESSVRKILVR
jgi:hypothetical protein